MTKAKMKPTTVKLDVELHALLPAISRAHSNKSIGSIIRNLLWIEAERLELTGDITREKGQSKRRHTT